MRNGQPFSCKKSGDPGNSPYDLHFYIVPQFFVVGYITMSLNINCLAISYCSGLFHGLTHGRMRMYCI
jgi:hypothetical protein